MKRPDVKICGLKSAEAIDLAVARGATHVGFIFFEKSPRHIDPLTAGELADRVRGKTKIVAVTVDADNEELEEIISFLKPDILQLHGHESPERVLNVKAVFGLPVMKVFSVRGADDLRAVSDYEGLADRFLFDAKAPAGSDLPGGNGVSFDWDVMGALDESVDYMLSGGINRDNVGRAFLRRVPAVSMHLREWRARQASRTCRRSTPSSMRSTNGASKRDLRE